jgi:hypothetical protein
VARSTPTSTTARSASISPPTGSKIICRLQTQ